MFGKKAQDKGVLAVIIVVAALILFRDPISAWLAPAPAEPSQEPPTVPGVQCPGVEDTSLSFSSTDVHDTGTTVGVNTQYWVNGIAEGTVNSSAGTDTVSPGDSIRALFSSDNAVYYGEYVNSEGEPVPCKGTFTLSGDLYLIDSSGVSLQVFDDAGELQTGAANNQSIAADETVTLTFRVKGTTDQYYGNPATGLNNVLVVEYDDTELEGVDVFDSSGTALASESVPIVNSPTTAGFQELGFEFPIISGPAWVSYSIQIEALPAVNPSDDVTLKIYDVAYDYNSETGTVDAGYEDENQADIGATTEPTATVYLD